MNAQYLDIVKMFLPEIVLTVGALLVLGIDLCLGKRNTRRGLVALAVLVSLGAAFVALHQWNRTDFSDRPYVQDTVKAIAMTKVITLNGEVVSDLQARADVATYKAARHDWLLKKQAHLDGADIVKNAYELNLASPAYNTWWLFRVDNFALVFKLIFSLALALVLLLTTRTPTERYRAEFAALLMLAAVGLMVMVSSLDLVIIFLGLELASLCFYALAAWNKNDARSAEAGTKYLLLGSLASAFFIYGASLFFVQYGSTHLTVLANGVLNNPVTPMTIVALFMMLVSFIFKVAGAPFHLWAPDVYQGAPTPMVAFLSTASKAAGFAVLVRVLFTAFMPVEVQANSLHVSWVLLISVVSGLSILLGNLVAIHQNNVKRLLAYSGIAQAGYILIGVAAMQPFLNSAGIYAEQFVPITAVIFYLFLYMVANIGAFSIVGIVGRESGSEEMSAFAGLRERAPILAFVMTLLLLSLGGIPLLSGFVGKWYLFMAGVHEGQYLLVFLGATMSVVSMYYYLLVVKQIYIMPAPADAKPIRVGSLASIGLTAIVLITLTIGIYWKPFYELAHQAAMSLTR